MQSSSTALDYLNGKMNFRNQFLKSQVLLYSILLFMLLSVRVHCNGVRDKVYVLRTDQKAIFLDHQVLKDGDTVLIDFFIFPFQQDKEVLESAQKGLVPVVEFLKNRPEYSIEIGCQLKSIEKKAFSTKQRCLNRAKTLQQFFINAGISKSCVIPVGLIRHSHGALLSTQGLDMVSVVLIFHK